MVTKRLLPLPFVVPAALVACASVTDARKSVLASDPPDGAEG
jgi:hypothetical protein